MIYLRAYSDIFNIYGDETTVYVGTHKILDDQMLAKDLSSDLSGLLFNGTKHKLVSFRHLRSNTDTFTNCNETDDPPGRPSVLRLLKFKLSPNL